MLCCTLLWPQIGCKDRGQNFYSGAGKRLSRGLMTPSSYNLILPTSTLGRRILGHRKVFIFSGRSIHSHVPHVQRSVEKDEYLMPELEIRLVWSSWESLRRYGRVSLSFCTKGEVDVGTTEKEWAEEWPEVERAHIFPICGRSLNSAMLFNIVWL